MSTTIMPAKAAAEPVSLDSITATGRLASRPLRKPNRRAERAGFRALTEMLPHGRARVLRHLAMLALELCDAGTTGVSILEDGPDGRVFRWEALAGKLARYEGGFTPRNFSPCGSCLDGGKPVLYSWPGRRFTYFNDLDTPIVEGLVIPIYENGNAIGTVWVVSHDPDGGFDAEDLRLMLSLAQFAGACLRSADTPAADAPARDPEEDRESAWRVYLSRIACNDQAALNALFAEARPLVFSIALRILAFAADAEEVTGDVFARLWSSGYRYEDHRGSAIGWIVSITRNMACDRMRVRARHAQRAEALSMECAGAADVEGRLLSAEQNLFLRQALETLPPEQRRAIELAYFTSLSHAEIAERLGQPLGTVKTRIRLGLIRLRSLMAAVQ